MRRKTEIPDFVVRNISRREGVKTGEQSRTSSRQRVHVTIAPLPNQITLPKSAKQAKVELPRADKTKIRLQLAALKQQVQRNDNLQYEFKRPRNSQKYERSIQQTE